MRRIAPPNSARRIAPPSWARRTSDSSCIANECFRLTIHWKRETASGLNESSSGSSHARAASTAAAAAARPSGPLRSLSRAHARVVLIAIQCIRITVSSLTYTSGRKRPPRPASTRPWPRRKLWYSGGIVPSGRTSWSTTSCRWRPGFQYAIHCSAFPAAAAASSPACSAASHGAGSSVSRLRSPLGFRRSPYTTSGCSVCVVAQRSYAAAIGSGDAPRAVKKACAKSERLASSAAVIGTETVAVSSGDDVE